MPEPVPYTSSRVMAAFACTSRSATTVTSYRGRGRQPRSRRPAARHTQGDGDRREPLGDLAVAGGVAGESGEERFIPEPLVTVEGSFRLSKRSLDGDARDHPRLPQHSAHLCAPVRLDARPGTPGCPHLSVAMRRTWRSAARRFRHGPATLMASSAVAAKFFGTVGTGDDSGSYPCLRALPLTCCSCRALFAILYGPAGHRAVRGL
jgi:hypothetical protein